MRKGIHPQLQWISHVTQTGRLINLLVTKTCRTDKVYFLKTKLEKARGQGNIEKFRRRYGGEEAEEAKDEK